MLSAAAVAAAAKIRKVPQHAGKPQLERRLYTCEPSRIPRHFSLVKRYREEPHQAVRTLRRLLLRGAELHRLREVGAEREFLNIASQLVEAPL